MDLIIVIPVIILLASLCIRNWVSSHPEADAGFLWTMFGVHFFLTLVYLLYAFATRSDSFEYYARSKEATDWFSFWESGTPFIKFLAWPFTHALGVSFISIMLIFSFMGFWACGYWYLSIKENLDQLEPVWKSFSWAELVMLLPNIHFWSASLGKGAIMFFSIALFVYGLSRFNSRPFHILLGILITYFIRPHISLVMAMGTGLGVVMAGKAVPWYLRVGLTVAAALVAGYFFQGMVEFTGVEDQSMDAFLAHRTSELAKADSGVDLSSYSLPMKLFTFWFRPLFVDAPGAFGYIVSFENLVYFYMLFVIVVKGFKFFAAFNGWFKACLFIFLLASVVLAQVSGNLGIAMRQKAQIMPLFFIAYLKVLELLQRRKYGYASTLNFS